MGVMIGPRLSTPMGRLGETRRTAVCKRDQLICDYVYRKNQSAAFPRTLRSCTAPLTQPARGVFQAIYGFGAGGLFFGSLTVNLGQTAMLVSQRCKQGGVGFPAGAPDCIAGCLHVHANKHRNTGVDRAQDCLSGLVVQPVAERFQPRLQLGPEPEPIRVRGQWDRSETGNVTLADH